MSVIVVATIHPLPDAREEVVAAVAQAAAAVHEEPGCELYALHEADDRLVMVEKWADADALAVHRDAPALKQLGAALKGKLAGPLDVQVLSPHPAGDAAKGAL